MMRDLFNFGAYCSNIILDLHEVPVEIYEFTQNTAHHTQETCDQKKKKSGCS
jgi:hypothetical protein